MQVAALKFAMTPRPTALSVEGNAQCVGVIRAGPKGADRVANQEALQPTGAPPPLLESRQLSRGSESDERRAMEEALAAI